MQFETLLVISQVFSTLFMTGLIWFVQVVHYPLFQAVGEKTFQEYANLHSKKTTFIVSVPMSIELIGAITMLFVTTPYSKSCLLLNFALASLIWVSTALVQVPYHLKLSLGFDPMSAKSLVTSNWIRTLAWTLKSAIWGYLLSRV